jgi:hypothetical protein
MTENQFDPTAQWMPTPPVPVTPARITKSAPPMSLILLWILAVALFGVGVITTVQGDNGLFGTYLLTGGFFALVMATSTQAIVSTLNGRNA